MFLKHYGLRKQPFGVTPDPECLFLGASHREAYASLIYGIEAGRGFMALIAPPGMGKTTLLFQVMKQIQGSARSAFLFQEQSNSREFLQNLAIDIGLECPDTCNLGELHRRLNEVLLNESHQGHRFVLILDEAQHLDPSILETVRMLSNFETTQTKLMQVILAGQPQLADRLASRELLQLHQRISVFARLDPLNPAEVEAYIAHRLKMAGYAGSGLFSRQALNRIAEASGGIPRVINNICFHSLSLGYVKRERSIDRATVDEVLNDLDLRSPAGSSPAKVSRQPAGQPLQPSVAREVERREHAEARFDSIPLQNPIQPPALPVRRARRRPLEWLLVASVLALAVWFFNESMSRGLPGRVTRWEAALAHLLGGGSASQAKVAPSQNVSPESPPQEKPVSPDGGKNHAGANPETTIPDRAASLGVSLNSRKPPALSSAATNEIGDLNGISGGESLLGKDAGGQEPSQSARSSTHLVGRGTRKVAAAKNGELFVTANVPGARILLNSTTKKDWFTPHTFSLPPGVYRVSLSRMGHRSFEELIDVKAGQATQVRGNLPVEDMNGSVIVETEPPGLPVVVDGKSYGPSPALASLSPGRHELQVLPPPGQVKYVGPFELRPRTMLKKTIRWSLEPAGSPVSANNP